MTDVVAPIARSWLRRVQADLDAVPYPTDAARQFAPGPDADRVLVLGNGAAIGFGVRTQEMALPGRLAARLRELTGRGAAVDVVAERGVTAAKAGRLLERTRPAHYDAVVLTIGATDSYGLLPLRQWRAHLTELLDRLRESTTPSTEVLVVAARPLQRPNAAGGTAGRVADAHAAQLDAITEELVGERDRMRFLPAPEGHAHAPRDVGDYTDLAARVAAPLAPLLDALAADPPGASARRLRDAADPELLRQSALERTGLLTSAPDVRLLRLVSTARDLFDVPAVGITLIDGDRLVLKAGEGLTDAEFPRVLAPCNRTIRQSGVLVVPDLLGEPVADWGWRFYAGHALESPDGYRIGSFCVFDSEPRAGIDEEAFADLALRMQSELWAEIARPDPAPAQPDEPAAPARERSARAEARTAQ